MLIISFQCFCFCNLSILYIYIVLISVLSGSCIDDTRFEAIFYYMLFIFNFSRGPFCILVYLLCMYRSIHSDLLLMYVVDAVAPCSYFCYLYYLLDITFYIWIGVYLPTRGIIIGVIWHSFPKKKDARNNNTLEMNLSTYILVLSKSLTTANQYLTIPSSHKSKSKEEKIQWFICNGDHHILLHPQAYDMYWVQKPVTKDNVLISVISSARSHNSKKKH